MRPFHLEIAGAFCITGNRLEIQQYIMQLYESKCKIVYNCISKFIKCSNIWGIFRTNLITKAEPFEMSFSNNPKIHNLCRKLNDEEINVKCRA